MIIPVLLRWYRYLSRLVIENHKTRKWAYTVYVKPWLWPDNSHLVGPRSAFKTSLNVRKGRGLKSNIKDIIFVENGKTHGLLLWNILFIACISLLLAISESAAFARQTLKDGRSKTHAINWFFMINWIWQFIRDQFC